MTWSSGQTLGPHLNICIYIIILIVPNFTRQVDKDRIQYYDIARCSEPRDKDIASSFLGFNFNVLLYILLLS